MFRVGGKKKALVIGLLLVLIAANVLVIFENSPKPINSTGKINPGKLVDYTKVFNAKLANPSNYLGTPNMQKKIYITIALRWRNEGMLNKSLEMINNPRSPMYHHFYSWSEFKKLYAPSDNVYNSIVDWLKDQGLNVYQTYPLHNSITIYDTIGNIQKVFHTEFGMYRGDGEHLRSQYFTIKKPIKFPENFIPYIVGIDGFNNATVYHLNFLDYQGTDYLSGADVAKMYRVYELYNNTPDGSASTQHIFATGLR
ncbi:TPA: peptidase S53, partial [Candidatus Aciduliprofundum boonei]|nr:peptidase S53 [Candidatus Aciduliprofundum boonei]